MSDKDQNVDGQDKPQDESKQVQKSDNKKNTLLSLEPLSKEDIKKLVIQQPYSFIEEKYHYKDREAQFIDEYKKRFFVVDTDFYNDKNLNVFENFYCSYHHNNHAASYALPVVPDQDNEAAETYFNQYCFSFAFTLIDATNYWIDYYNNQLSENANNIPLVPHPYSNPDHFLASPGVGLSLYFEPISDQVEDIKKMNFPSFEYLIDEVRRNGPLLCVSIHKDYDVLTEFGFIDFNFQNGHVATDSNGKFPLMPQHSVFYIMGGGYTYTEKQGAKQCLIIGEFDCKTGAIDYKRISYEFLLANIFFDSNFSERPLMHSVMHSCGFILELHNRYTDFFLEHKDLTNEELYEIYSGLGDLDEKQKKVKSDFIEKFGKKEFDNLSATCSELTSGYHNDFLCALNGINFPKNQLKIFKTKHKTHQGFHHLFNEFNQDEELRSKYPKLMEFRSKLILFQQHMKFLLTIHNMPMWLEQQIAKDFENSIWTQLEKSFLEMKKSYKKLGNKLVDLPAFHNMAFQTADPEKVTCNSFKMAFAELMHFVKTEAFDGEALRALHNLIAISKLLAVKSNITEEEFIDKRDSKKKTRYKFKVQRGIPKYLNDQLIPIQPLKEYDDEKLQKNLQSTLKMISKTQEKLEKNQGYKWLSAEEAAQKVVEFYSGLCRGSDKNVEGLTKEDVISFSPFMHQQFFTVIKNEDHKALDLGSKNQSKEFELNEFLLYQIYNNQNKLYQEVCLRHIASQIIADASIANEPIEKHIMLKCILSNYILDEDQYFSLSPEELEQYFYFPQYLTFQENTPEINLDYADVKQETKNYIEGVLYSQNSEKENKSDDIQPEDKSDEGEQNSLVSPQESFTHENNLLDDLFQVQKFYSEESFDELEAVLALHDLSNFEKNYLRFLFIQYPTKEKILRYMQRLKSIDPRFFKIVDQGAYFLPPLIPEFEQQVIDKSSLESFPLPSSQQNAAEQFTFVHKAVVAASAFVFYKIVKNISSQVGSPNYSQLAWRHFQNTAPYSRSIHPRNTTMPRKFANSYKNQQQFLRAQQKKVSHAKDLKPKTLQNYNKGKTYHKTSYSKIPPHKRVEAKRIPNYSRYHSKLDKFRRGKPSRIDLGNRFRAPMTGGVMFGGGGSVQFKQ